MEEEWELVDISGPFSAWTLAAETNSLVYSIGSHVIVWNLDTDTKCHLRCHECAVVSILFHPSNEFFLTIEASLDPFISVWTWGSLAQACVQFLPQKIRKQPPAVVDSCLVNTILFVLESEKDTGYRVSRWEWEGNTLEMMDVSVLENKEKAMKIRGMDEGCVFTVEKTFIKIWEATERISLIKRLFFKSEILDVEFCADLNAFALLLGTHNFVIVHTTGVILTTFSQTYYSFFIQADCLFLGGSSLQIYSLKSYSLLSELLQSELKITQILSNGGSLACVRFENSTVQVIELDRGSVLKVLAFHGTEITSFSWSLSGNFVTSGHENCVYIWNKQDFGWGLEAIELGKEHVSALAIGHGLLAVGFVNGQVCVFNDEMQKIASNRLVSAKVTDLKLTRTAVLLAAFSCGLAAAFDATY
jgi:WD40 repeat protein